MSFYAVPLVLFYPVMIVIVGINAMSVIILATIMAAIPMALNTAVGLNTMPPVYMKLARSLKASPRQTLFAIAIPAAGPYIVAGLRLAVVYALIGTIAMEFTTAQAGLGYRIRYLYEIFNNNEMFAYIAVVLVLSCILTAAAGRRWNAFCCAGGTDDLDPAVTCRTTSSWTRPRSTPQRFRAILGNQAVGATLLALVVVDRLGDLLRV